MKIMTSTIRPTAQQQQQIMPKKSRRSADKKEESNSNEAINASMYGRDGRDGKDGKDGETPDINLIAELVPHGKDGKDGKDGKTPDINAIADLVPSGKNGEIGKTGPAGKDGKDGRNGSDGKSITGVEIDKNNTISVSIDGIKKKIGQIKSQRAEFSGKSGGGTSGVFARKGSIIFNADYVSGDTVEANTMVNDDGWLMMSNKKTSEPAAITPIGAEFNVYSGTLTEQSVLAKQVIFGTRYTAKIGGYINGYRVDTVVGNEYSVYSVKNPLSSPVVTELSQFTGKIKGFQSINIDPVILLSGQMFDLVVVENEPAGTPAITIINYDYNTPVFSVVPNSGEIVHTNSDSAVLSVHKTDDDGADQSAFLLSLGNGDLIRGPNVKWSIQSLIDQGAYIDFLISPSTQDTPDGVYGFGFETVIQTPIPYGEDLNYWAGNPSVQGLFIVDGNYNDIIPDDTARGADLIVQDARVPVDYDLVMPQGGSTGGSSALSNVRLESVGRFETSADQLIPGLGAVNLITVNYGAGGTTAGNEFSVSAGGVITSNTDKIQYHYGFVFRLSRSGASGVSQIMLRLMYAVDGIAVNAVQINNTFVVEIDSPRTIWRESFDFDFEPAQGSLLWVEVARDASGDDSGDISTAQPTGDAVGWNQSRSAILTLDRYITG